MTTPDETPEAAHRVVVIHEEQCSIHTPDGEAWRDAGSRDECLAPIGAVWIGVRPPGFRATEPAGR